MSPVSPREFGALEQRVANMEAVVREQTAKLDQLIALANRGKGAYWAGIFVATGIGSAITFLLRFFNLKIGT